MHFHSQNLNKLGSKIKRGRCWWHINDKNCINFEWVLWSKDFHIGILLGAYENAIQLTFGLILFTVYLSWENHKVEYWVQDKIKRKTDTYGNGREIAIKWHHETLWIDLWNDPMEWNNTDPWWWSFNFNPKDILLGRQIHTPKDISKTNVTITMPENTYNGTVRIFESTWKRPRWPFPIKLVRTDIDVPEGIPVPGKGENSWDCGQDAIFSLTSSEQTVSGAIGALVKDVLKTRERYGGLNWKPEMEEISK